MEWGYGRENSLLRQQAASPEQSKARLIELERKFEALALQVGGRRLTPEQSKIIERGARVPNGASFAVKVAYEGGCLDCITYAADFERVLRAAGWSAKDAMVIGPSNRPPSGLGLGVSYVDTPTAEQQALRGALQAANVNFDFVRFSAKEPHTELLIAAR